MIHRKANLNTNGEALYFETGKLKKSKFPFNVTSDPSIYVIRPINLTSDIVGVSCSSLI